MPVFPWVETQPWFPMGKGKKPAHLLKMSPLQLLKSLVLLGVLFLGVGIPFLVVAQEPGIPCPCKGHLDSKLQRGPGACQETAQEPAEVAELRHRCCKQRVPRAPWPSVHSEGGIRFKAGTTTGGKNPQRP